MGIPTIAQASGGGLGGWRSVASSWWGGDPSDPVADPAPPETPSTPSASPSTSDADPSATPSRSRKPRASRTSPTPSASPAKTKSPAAKPPARTPEKQAAPASTPKATEADRAPRTSTSNADSGPTARVLALVNAERQKAGCAPVTENAKLTKAAQNHSQDMADHQNMSHTGSDGSDMSDRLARVGYRFRSAGENVAAGYGTPESVMDGWMNSPGHRANILNCGFKEIGIGLAQPGNYWTQNFGTSA
ncbi:CAP domain-containing protein [Streptomyces sp. NPDC012510]|uniref:CAP domain-containing protein n=1 Tax=Streptomyces sp. NPDC012510 TaxID=3364838 RepID=UPI0036F0A969